MNSTINPRGNPRIDMPSERAKEYGLEELGKEFISSATGFMEKDYILPKTVGDSKVHLLLGVKNTRVQPILLRVLPLGVGVYLSLFKDVWGSRIIFSGPS